LPLLRAAIGSICGPINEKIDGDELRVEIEFGLFNFSIKLAAHRRRLNFTGQAALTPETFHETEPGRNREKIERRTSNAEY
jgi:hypothetical protein